MNWKRRFSVWLDGQAARRAANWVTHSRYHAAELAREYRIPVDKIHLVPLAVEELKQPMTAAPKPTSPHPTIAYIGTLDQRKGIDVFLRAIPGISRDEPGSQFLIIGHDGGDSPSISWREWFADEYKDATLLSKVEFTGFVPDDQMLKLWNRIDVVVVPSRYESFGLVVVEAYLHCIPVIISDGGALPEVAGDAALIFASGHADDLAERVLTVLQQPNRAEDLAARGHRRFDEKYTLDRFAENIVNLYKVVL
jgi:glycosyltransferase involved in cell wall biosynthesis